MIMSLLSLQSRRTANAEVVSQLAVAANRVAAIERVHRRLHCADRGQAVALKQYREDFCGDFAPLLVLDENGERGIAVEGVDADLPIATVIPLGFIANELITNAVKHGRGRIVVGLELGPHESYALSVSNAGPPLPEGLDPAASRGSGMTIVRSLAEKIGGELHVGQADKGEGARFTVMFPRT